MNCLIARKEKSLLLSMAVLAVLLNPISSLDNGLALTPPMGWLAWERFRCNIDCVNDPENCISEQLFKTMGDFLVSEGYADVGYNIICMDDCWLAQNRSVNEELQPDADRFPSGMLGLANYIHNLGLLFGVYEDLGIKTCAGYPGLHNHFEIDANTFANWTVDYVKIDGCFYNPLAMDKGYADFGFYLNQTGRPIIYSGEGPFYQHSIGVTANWTAQALTLNLWRNFDDIQDSWDSVQRVIDHWGNKQDLFADAAGPGAWNDPDMLIIGNFGLSYEQSKSQMAMWAIFAAPLLMSNDLRSILPEYKAILQNTAVIAIDQDPLGIQGRRIYQNNDIEYWTRPVTPNYGSIYSYAIAFLNRRTDGTPSQVSETLEFLGLTEPTGYNITDLFDNVNYGVYLPTDTLTVSVNPTGVVIVKCEVLSSKKSKSKNINGIY